MPAVPSFPLPSTHNIDSLLFRISTTSLTVADFDKCFILNFAGPGYVVQPTSFPKVSTMAPKPF